MGPPIAAHADVSGAPRTPAGFEIGGQVSGYRYEEPSVDVSLSGGRVGVTGAFTFAMSPTLFGRVEARYAYGELSYDGSGTKDNVPDTVFETRALFGGDVPIARKVSLSPYLGYGYRYLYNNLTGTTSTGAVGYRRYSNYWYVPVGVTARFRTDGVWMLVPTVEYDYFLRGKQVSKLSDTGLGYSDATNSQDSGYGARISFSVENGRFAVGPWLQYWKIDDSDLVVIRSVPLTYGLEPHNWTREIGVEVRYRF
jgi:hypothetical protein